MDVIDDTDVVIPLAESDAELEFDPCEPRFPSTAWGRLNEAGWHGAKSPSQLERHRIAVLIAVRNNFSVPVQEGMRGSVGPNPNDNGWVSEFWEYQYFWETCSVNPFCHLTMDQTGDTYEHPNSDEIQLSGFPVMLDEAEWWIFCRTFLLLEIPIPQTMDSFLGWVTGVVSDLLFWVVGVRGADALEGGGETCPQVMDFGLVLLRFLMICGGQDMFPHYMDERYFLSEFYPWSVD